jgi:hypothetical protein
MRTLRLIAAILLVTPVMLMAGAIAYALMLAMYPFAYLRNTGSLLLEALLRELYRPL